MLFDKVKQRRKTLRLSQGQLAKLAGVGRNVVFSIEHGNESVQLDKIQQVLDVLNLELTLREKQRNGSTEP